MGQSPSLNPWRGSAVRAWLQASVLHTKAAVQLQSRGGFVCGMSSEELSLAIAQEGSISDIRMSSWPEVRVIFALCCDRVNLQSFFWLQ